MTEDAIGEQTNESELQICQTTLMKLKVFFGRITGTRPRCFRQWTERKSKGVWRRVKTPENLLSQSEGETSCGYMHSMRQIQSSRRE